MRQLILLLATLLLMAAYASLAAGASQGDIPLKGLRFGMTIEEVLGAYPQAERIDDSERSNQERVGASLQIPEIGFGGVTYVVAYLFFNNQGHKGLTEIKLMQVFEYHASDGDANYILDSVNSKERRAEDTVRALLGAPTSRKAERGFVKAKWLSPQRVTTVTLTSPDLGIFYVIIEFFEPRKLESIPIKWTLVKTDRSGERTLSSDTVDVLLVTDPDPDPVVDEGYKFVGLPDRFLDACRSIDLGGNVGTQYARLAANIIFICREVADKKGLTLAPLEIYTEVKPFLRSAYYDTPTARDPAKFRLGVRRFQIKGLLPPEMMPARSVKELPKDARAPLDYGSILNQLVLCGDDIFNANGIVKYEKSRRVPDSRWAQSMQF